MWLLAALRRYMYILIISQCRKCTIKNNAACGVYSLHRLFLYFQHIGKKIKLKKSKGDKDKHASSKFEEGSVAQFRQLKYVRAHQFGLRTLVQQQRVYLEKCKQKLMDGIVRCTVCAYLIG